MITPEQRSEALEASIEKWRRNAVASSPEEYTLGWRDCPLCLLFTVDDEGMRLPKDEICQGCPVYTKTGQQYCSDTPYDAAENAFWEWEIADNDDDAALARARAKANEMVSFLETCRESK